MPDLTIAVKELIYKMADDSLIMGHRNSEWTGIGPTIEEDISFGSLAQDKVGHSFNLYQLLNDLGEEDPDQLAFHRKENEFRCCQLVEYPIGEYDFSLVRHFLFDTAEMVRYEALTTSTFEPLAQLARKVKGEIKYHIFHANTWLKQLAKGTEESKARMQSSLNFAFPLAFAIFEPGPFDHILSEKHIITKEEKLLAQWIRKVEDIVHKAGLTLPEVSFEEKSGYGGRFGYHTEYLAPLLLEMTEVFSIDPAAEW